jgi:proteic killer suppression protein
MRGRFAHYGASRYSAMVIASFKCRDTERLFLRTPVGRWPRSLQERARVKLLMLHAATTLDDLRSPAGNRLERLRGDRAGQHSIRVNDQWRICFIWREGHAHNVEMVDYR